MCLTADADVIDLSMVDSVDGTSHAVTINRHASVDDLACASAAVLGVKTVEIVFSGVVCTADGRSTLDAIGMRAGAIYEVNRPEREKPEPPRCTVDWARVLQLVAATACIMTPFVILGLSVYGLIEYNTTGCRQPVCTVGGVLQCCTVDEFGGTCVPRPDLQGLTCASWQRAVRPCEQYQCRYTRGSDVIYKDANDNGFEELPESTRVLSLVGIIVSVFVIVVGFCGSTARTNGD